MERKRSMPRPAPFWLSSSNPAPPFGLSLSKPSLSVRAEPVEALSLRSG